MCELCTPGAYSESRASTCLSCSAGWYASASGTANNCTRCAPGTFSSAGSSVCLQCRAGGYARLAGSTSCATCDAGLFSATGASECTECAPGQFSFSNASTCTACGKGGWSNSTRMSSCALCVAGKFSESVAATSSSACQLCPNGTYSAQLGAGSNLACAWCPPGRFAPEGSSACLACSPNTYSDVQAGSCIGCPAYSDSPSGATLSQCVCRRGYKRVGLGPCSDTSGACFRCEGCPLGQYSNTTNSSTCFVCGRGKYGNMTLGPSEGAACASCQQGTYGTGVALAGCAACVQGTYNTGVGLTICIACSPGSFASNNGSSVCQRCSVGTYSNTSGAAECKGCDTGSYADEPAATVCMLCQPGAYNSNTSASACSGCVPGTYLSSSGARSPTQCSACAAGKYSTSTGLSTSQGCSRCPDGTSSGTGASSCGGCPANTFPDSVLGGCVSCPRNSVSMNASNAAGCLCPPGYFHSYNSKAYGGEMSFSVGNDGRTYRNHVYPNGIGELVVVKTVMMEMTCTGADGVSREVIMRDQYYPNAYPVRMVDTAACRLPFIITYEVDGMPDPAETQTYFECKRCSPGFFSDVQGVDACTMCLSGSYQNVSGATTCKSCDAGSYSGDGMDRCEKCPLQTFQSGNECQMCPAGKFTLTQGATSCVGCPPHTWSEPDIFGTLQGCRQCPPWSTSSGGTGVSGCKCFEGLYLYSNQELLLATGELACLPCAAGTYSPANSNVCRPCPPGTFSATGAAAVCTPCARNASSLGGATACTPCPFPTVATQDGSGCQPCPAGFICKPTGEIVTCPAGKYGPTAGLTSLSQCQQCPINKVCADGKTMESCPPNTYSLAGSTKLTDCKCRDGFDCTYTKSVKGLVVLPVAPENFDATMRQNFINAIAAAAGVSPSRVKIVSISLYVPPSTTRSMRVSRLRRTEVQVRVTGALNLVGVDETLRRFGFPRSVVRTKVSWDHHVEARRAVNAVSSWTGGWI